MSASSLSCQPARTPRLAEAHALVPRHRRRLLAWYRRHRRTLPWRSSSDPYRIWIAEVMLQQTQVEVVIPYYERFLARFPDVSALARAPLASVLDAWAGLGYYARARQLHAAAGVLVSEHGGDLRAAADALLSLPGIGPYTAGAIRSIAWDEPAPIVDGNVARVFTRLFALDGAAESRAMRAQLWDLATRWAATRRPGDANQALMELGALVCTKAQPGCGRCPLAIACAARRSHRVHELPPPRRRPLSARLEIVAGLVHRGNRLLLVRRRSGRLLRDWWELPSCLGSGTRVGGSPPDERRAATGATAAGQALGAALRERFGLRSTAARHLATVQHGILSYRLAVHVLACGVRAGGNPVGEGGLAPTPSPGRTARRSSPAQRGRAIVTLEGDSLEYRWMGAADCRRAPLSTLARKALDAAARHDGRWRAYTPAPRAPAEPAPLSAARFPAPSERRSSRRGT